MKIDITTLKTAISKKSYKWYSDLNLIGIRTTLQAPDVFNDIMCVAWNQKAMPAGLTPIQQQEWLNKNLYVGKDGKMLLVDGDFGTNSNYALEQYNATVGKERFKTYTITTDPGVYWLEHPMNKLGAAVLKPGQYENCWALGYHQNKQDHPALVQVGKITVYRDNDKDKLAEALTVEDTGYFGVNIHGSNKVGVTPSIGKWSAGCQVFNNWANKEQMLAICKMYKTERNNKFTYTLLEEKELG